MRFAIGMLLFAAVAKPADYLVFAGTYTKAPERGIYAFRFNSARGTLSPLGMAAQTSGTSFYLAEHPNHRFLYAADADGRSVSAFAIEAAAGKLRLLNQIDSGDGPCHLAVDATGRWLAIANYNDGTMVVVAIRSDGSLGSPSATERHQGSGANPQRQEGPHAHGVLFTPDNRSLLLADLGLDKIFVYRFDAVRGAVTPNQPEFVSVAAGAGPRHLALHPNGRALYVINELANTVAAFHYDAATGALAAFQTVATLPDGFSGISYAAEIAFNRAGTHLYASNRGHESIAEFSCDRDHQKLTLAGRTSTLGKFPGHFALDPTEHFLLAANQDSDEIVVFRIDPRSGGLMPAGAAAKMPKPACIVFVPPV